jgi:hypothetical protein
MQRGTLRAGEPAAATADHDQVELFHPVTPAGCPRVR